MTLLGADSRLGGAGLAVLFGIVAGGCAAEGTSDVIPGTGGDTSVEGPGVANGDCAAGQQRCGDVCVDVTTSSSNCGQCGVSCPSGQSCVDGTCGCPQGQIACNGVCTDTLGDVTNCGGCGTICPAGAQCLSGQCTCPAGLADCGGACVDLLNDGSHCGACNVPCAAGLVCSSGQCSSSCTLPGQIPCGTSCVDISNDANNCGGCGIACAGGQTCQNGTCACASGLSLCAGQCTDTATDDSNCGGCGVSCGAGQSCVGGVCSGAATGTGGAAGIGGSGVGGSAAGGAATGGAATGGAATGGAATGGAATGGAATGGAATGGAATGGASTGGNASTGGASSCSEEETLFSFFVTSYEAVQRLSGSTDGFGGDLGGLSGADALCQQIAEYSTPCAANRQWRAFLSTVAGPVHAKDRIGTGPWYDRVGRVVAMNLTDLLNERPVGIDPVISNDLPNEYGVPNHDPDGTGDVDNHDTLTGTNSLGELYSDDPGCTCQDWTSSVGSDGLPRVGHTWGTAMGGGGGPMGGGDGSMSNWMSALDEAGCAPGVNLIQNGGPNPNNPTVGSGGGYGGWYCFALPL